MSVIRENMSLIAGQVVDVIPSGGSCRVKRAIGAGTQGCVYEVILNGKSYALKWYHPEFSTRAQRQIIERLVDLGSFDGRFLWPLSLTTARDVPGFGYIMPLRERRYECMTALVTRAMEPTFRTTATAGFHLADSFLQLHSKGLCYKDISFNNIFMDGATGEVLICDNDNVTVEGSAFVGILGTPRFMAPEIVRGEAQPSIQTDLFSLAVLLFYMLMLHHPLEGERETRIRCLDMAAMSRLYGSHALFIFDPDDHSNQPVPGIQDNPLAFWPLYPEFVRKLFVQAFTEGIREPNKRVRESIWRRAMIQLRDLIVYCGHCGMESFYDAEASDDLACWQCGQEVRIPPRLHVGGNVIILNHDAKVFPHHVDRRRSYDFSRPIARISRNPRNRAVWGLMNLSQVEWIVTHKAGTARVATSKSISLTDGTTIGFGTAEGRIHAV
jgi:DNA-binding helix-hairpin-helix protein with protein kinase domain